MKNTLILIISFMVLAASSSAQKSEPITVKAGTRVQDYFPLQERYRYPGFIDGTVVFKNGATTDAKLNYNLLSGEMEYIHSRDTLAISNPIDINYIALQEEDTFFYNRKSYLELIFSDKIKVALKQNITLKQVLKHDSYGVSGSGSATESINSLQTTGNSYKLIVNQDRVFQKISEFFLTTSSGEFVPFTKKKILQLFPQKKEAIHEYLKSNKVDFESKNDLVRLVGFLQNL